MFLSRRRAQWQNARAGRATGFQPQGNRQKTRARPCTLVAHVSCDGEKSKSIALEQYCDDLLDHPWPLRPKFLLRRIVLRLRQHLRVLPGQCIDLLQRLLDGTIDRLGHIGH